ncbi:hypothetical protein M9Y10_007845 [Tritrichomonas musculus]|uniref:USP domain-containing protein n=1 Tax=Tritrichomonas musculus TaxID=1915356 RepID=A0ABR2J383_9EUKA
MQPEEDFETWKLIILTVTDDIISFSSMFPDLKRLMESIEETNYLPGELKPYTKDFIEESFPDISASVITTTSSLTKNENNINEFQVISDFFRSTIKLCVSKIARKTISDLTNENESDEDYKNSLSVSIKMINLLSNIFDKIDLDPKPNDKEKVLNQTFFYYFLNDLKGIDKCNSAIESINNHIDQINLDSSNTDTNNSDSTKKTNLIEEILEKESSKISIIVKLIQKVVLATTIKNKQNSEDKKDKIEQEKEKYTNYYGQLHLLINKTFPIFQKICEKNLRKFNASHLDPLFETLTKSYQIDFSVSKEDDFPLTLNLFDLSQFTIFSTFLKSDFFEKHLYSLKNISLLCTKTVDHYNDNKEYYESDQEKRKTKKLNVLFIDKEVLLNAVIDHLKLIQNLRFNKEFGEPLGAIYAFIIENKEDIITIDDIKNLWSTIKFLHSADLSSFFKIFEKVTKVMNEENNKEFIDFALSHVSSETTNEKESVSLKFDKNFADFLYFVACNFERKKFREPFKKVRSLFWSFSFDEKGIETDEMKEYARSKLSFLCDFCSNEMIELLVKEKVPTLPEFSEENKKNEEREFILRLIDRSITKQEEINEDSCNKLIQFCISQLQDKSMINILTSICTTQKVTLEKDQIEQLSNISNKFLTNILLSSGFDDAYIENFFLTTKNIDSDLYDLIEKYVLQKNKQWESIENDYLTHLPFEKEDLLWTFSVKKSDVRHKFINKLCQIYSNNDGYLLTDKQMINHFLNRVESLIDDPEKRENCFQLLQRFINSIDETNPDLIDIKKSDKSNDLIQIEFNGIQGKFNFSKNNATLVAYYKASQILNVPLSQVTLLYGDNPADTEKTFSQLSFMKESIELVPIVGDESSIRRRHLRTVSPSTQICHSDLMNKLISFLKDDKANDNNTFVLMTLLLDLPTSEPVYNMINYFYIKEKIDYERIFPINYPKFFVYSLNALQQMGGNLKDEVFRTNGIEYLIHAVTRVNSLYLISEIVDYLKSTLDTDELIEKYSNQLFEALMRLCMCLPASYQESCLSFMKKLKPTNIPKCDTDYEIKFVESEKEKKEEKVEDNRPIGEAVSSSLSLLEQFSDFSTYDFINSSIELFKEFKEQKSSNLQPKEEEKPKKKEEKTLEIDNEIPFSHVITNVITITLIKKNVYINENIEVKDEEPSAYLKKTAKETFEKLPIPSEYFESIFKYLTPLNYKEFLSAFSPHAVPPTDTAIQFIIDNLDIKSKHLPFVMNVLKQVINSITNEEKRSQIFKIIFDNFFILDRDESIEDSVFEDAMIVAGSAPLEMITKRIDEIGIPTFNKYRINGRDFKPDKCTTGLKNLGSSCYFNSILQQFYHCPSLRKALIEYKGDDQLFKEMGLLFSQMRDGSLKFVSPKSVIDNWICWDGEKLNPRVQQDASEFTIMMIDKLSPIIPNSMFNGKLLFKVEGINQEDEYLAERNEPFSVLILPINQSKTLEECLTAFNSPSFFTNNNQYYADTLKRKIDAKQSDFIQELPDHLILQLKRFEYDYSQGIRKKINSHISISKEIDVASICDFKEKNDKINTKYNLVGVIQHMGSAMGGHYYSFVMQRDTKMWYKFNDSEVTPTTIDDVLENSNGRDSNAYLLFYDRSDLDEIDDSKVDPSFAEQNQIDMKMNSYYYFYMTNGFIKFLNEISKRKELQLLASKLILNILPYSNVETNDDYFVSLQQRLYDREEATFANEVQNEVKDFKFLILNEARLINILLAIKLFHPMFSHWVQQRLLQSAIDTFDLANEKLSDSSFFFKILFSMVNIGVALKNLYIEKENKEKGEEYTKLLTVICEKTTEIMKTGIKKYISSQSDLNPQYVLESINMGDIARLFNVFEELPKDYVELLQDVEFLRSLYACKKTKVCFFLDNYIRARKLGLFDVNSLIKTFVEKESIHLDMKDLFITIFMIFKEEAFPMTWSLKFKYNGNYRTPNDIVLCYTLLCIDGIEKETFLDHFDKWIPTLIMHENNDTRSMVSVPLRYLIPNKLFQKEYGDIPTYNKSMIYTTEFFNKIDLKKENTPEMRKNAYNLIQCLFGSLSEMKEIIEKEDYSSSFSFQEDKYRATQLLRLIKVMIKIFNSPVKTTDDSQTDTFSIDYSKLNEFGEFLLKSGHSHPFDPQIILILKILKSNCSDQILIHSIPSDEVMLTSEKVQKIPSEWFEQYMKIMKKIMKKAAKKKLPLSEEFLTKYYRLIAFNLININLIVKSAKPIEKLNDIFEIICDSPTLSKSITNYIDDNFEACVHNGFHSIITCLRYLKIKRPLSQYVHSLNFRQIFQQIKINYPIFYYEIILANGSKDTSESDSEKVTCYDTLFDNPSELIQCLCQKGSEIEKDYENHREVIWDYLINNTRKRINESQNDSKIKLQTEIFHQFMVNYNFHFFNLLLDFQEQQKELETITKFVLELIDIDDAVEKLIFLSKSSFGALNLSFNFLKEKVPEKLKDSEFISDCLSNKVFSKNIGIVLEFCEFAFNGKTKDEIESIFKQSRIVTNLIEKLNLLNFIYQGGVIEKRFESEDEDELSSVIVPIHLLMKYKEHFAESNELKSEAASLLDKLKSLNINCQTKVDVVETITKLIS